eukprot:3695632-Pyramimonas_sp.AAC.1
MGSVELECLAGITKQLADDAVATDVKESKARFGDWIDGNSAGGGAALHAFTKEPAVNASAIQGVAVPLGKMEAVKALVCEWSECWRTAAEPPKLSWPADLGERPRRPTPAQLRRA